MDKPQRVEPQEQPDRRQRDRRQTSIKAIQTEFDRLSLNIRHNDEKVKELEAAQKVQLVRIAQIQQEIEALKRSRD